MARKYLEFPAMDHCFCSKKVENKVHLFSVFFFNIFMLMQHTVKFHFAPCSLNSGFKS